MSFETFDIALALIFAIAFFVGYRQGFISQLGMLCSVAAGAWASYHFSEDAMRFVSQWEVLPLQYQRPAAHLVLFLLVAIPTRMLANLLLKSVRYMGLGMLDRFMGGFLGLTKWVMLSSLFFTLYQEVDRDGKLFSHRVRSEALLYTPVQKLAPTLFPFVREWFSEITLIPKS